MKRHSIYRKPLPRDMLATFQGQDAELTKYLLGEAAYAQAHDLDLTFQLLTGKYDFNLDFVEVIIYIQGPEKNVTFWLLSNTVK